MTTLLGVWQHYSACSMSGSVAERSKALVLGTSLFGGVGSNPTAATNLFDGELCFIGMVFHLLSSNKQN